MGARSSKTTSSGKDKIPNSTDISNQALEVTEALLRTKEELSADSREEVSSIGIEKVSMETELELSKETGEKVSDIEKKVSIDRAEDILEKNVFEEKISEETGEYVSGIEKGDSTETAKEVPTDIVAEIGKEAYSGMDEVCNFEAGNEVSTEITNLVCTENGNEFTDILEPDVSQNRVSSVEEAETMESRIASQAPPLPSVSAPKEVIMEMEKYLKYVQISERGTFPFRAAATLVRLGAGAATIATLVGTAGLAWPVVLGVGVGGSIAGSLVSTANSYAKGAQLKKIQKLMEIYRKHPTIQKLMEEVEEEFQKNEYWFHTFCKSPCQFVKGKWKTLKSGARRFTNWCKKKGKKIMNWLKRKLADDIAEPPNTSTTFDDVCQVMDTTSFAAPKGPLLVTLAMKFINWIAKRVAPAADDVLAAVRPELVAAKHLTRVAMVGAVAGMVSDVYSLGKDTYDLAKNKEGKAIRELIEAMKNLNHIEDEV